MKNIKIKTFVFDFDSDIYSISSIDTRVNRFLLNKKVIDINAFAAKCDGITVVVVYQEDKEDVKK